LLEVHLLRAGGLRGRMSAAFAVWRGNWRELPALRSVTCRKVVIKRRGKRSSTVAMDGEIRRLKHPLTFQIMPRALHVLAPLPEQPAP
jgi:diacylglycerol kinase family enzyme